MNLLDNRTIGQMVKAYAEKQKSKVAKSPNMAVAGVTGKGDYPVKPAVPDKNRARAFKVGPEYYTPEAKAKRAEEAKLRQMKEESRGGDRYGFTGLG